MAARDEESDLESDWTFVDRGTVESVETRQGSVFYSKRTASQSSDGAPCSPDVAMVTAEGSGSEAEFEVLAPAQTVPDSSGSLCEEESDRDGSVDVTACTGQVNLATDNADMPSASSENSEISHCIDDGIMIISNHFSPSLEENHDNLHSSLILSSSFHGWQELPQLTESSTYSLTDEPSISDDETGIVTISDEVEDQEVEFVDLEEHRRADEGSSMSEHSDSSSFLFDSDLFDVSEDLEVLDLSESLEVDAARLNHPAHQNNDEYKEEGSDFSDGDDSNDEEEEEEEKEEELGSLITVDAPTLVILLCLTTALGFSIGHGLNVYLTSHASINSSDLKRPGPDTASLQNQHLGLKLPEDNINQGQVYLWEQKEASIALMFDLKELHSTLQKEHFSLLKSYDNMKNRLHVSKVMGWYWRWKFEHERVVSENLSWTKALEKQVERLQALYAHEKRLADLWRGVKEKEARDKLHKHWKTLHQRWIRSGVQTSGNPTYKVNVEKSSPNPEVGVCSKFPADFKRRWTQDARGTDHALHQYRIAVSNGQETRVFKWDQIMMKSVRETGDPADNEGPHNLLAIHYPGLVKDVVLNPHKKSQDQSVPLSLRLVLEDGSVKDISSHFDNSKENGRTDTGKGRKIDIGNQSKHSAPLYKESDTSKHVDLAAAKYPAASDGVRESRHAQEQLGCRALLYTKRKSGAGADELCPMEKRDTGEGKNSSTTLEKREDVTFKTKKRDTGEVKNSSTTLEKRGDVTSKTNKRRIQKPCFEKSSEEKGHLEQEKPEELPLANETISDIHGKLGMKGKEIRRKGRLAREKEIRKERLVRRKVKQREKELGRHVRRAGKILQALYSERRRIRRQKVQLRHERSSVEKAKTKLDDERKEHEQRQDDVEKLIVQLKTEKERLQKWHKEGEEAFKQIRKLERDRLKCEREKGTELRQIKTKLSIERRKLKSDYKELKSLKKAVRKEYKKWLRELRQVHKKDKKSHGKNKPDMEEKKGVKGHEYERHRHKGRDKKKARSKAKKKRELEDIKTEKEKTYRADIVQSKAPFKTKRNKGKERMKKHSSSDKSIENSKGRMISVSDNEQRGLTQEGHHYDYRKQLEKLRQWLLQIEEQKLDQEQLQRDYRKPVRKIQKPKKAEKTAVQPEKSKAVAAFTNLSLDFDASSDKVHETQEKNTSMLQERKSGKTTDNTEGLGTVMERKGLYTRYTTVPALEPVPSAKSHFKREASGSEASEHNESKPKCPDVSPYPTVGGLGPNEPIPPDKLRVHHKPGSSIHLDQGRQFDGNFCDRWVNYASKQESCFSSRNPKPPEGPIPPENLRLQPEDLRLDGQWKDEPWCRGDESWYMRRAKERESLRKSTSFHTRKQRAHKPSSWIFERASNRAEQRSNWEPWYERRAKGRDEWRAGHRDTWFLERNYYRKMMRYLSDWRESLVSRGPTKRRGCWGA